MQISSERRQLVTGTANLLSSFYFGPSYISDLRQRFTYLQVPVLARIDWGRVYVEAGPQADYLLGGREEGQITYLNLYSNNVFYMPLAIDRRVRERYRRVDVGACAGIGVNLAAGIGLSVRAYQEVASLTQANNADVYDYQGRQLRQSLQTSLTYQLPGHL